MRRYKPMESNLKVLQTTLNRADFGSAAHGWVALSQKHSSYSLGPQATVTSAFNLERSTSETLLFDPLSLPLANSLPFEGKNSCNEYLSSGGHVKKLHSICEGWLAPCHDLSRKGDMPPEACV